MVYKGGVGKPLCDIKTFSVTKNKGKTEIKKRYKGSDDSHGV
jgi:hypothetical protein